MTTEPEGTAEPERVLLFADDAGGYYAVPEAVIRRGRIPAERLPALEGAGVADDVAGFLFCTNCGHHLTPPPGADPTDRRYRLLGPARLELGGRM